MEPTTEKERDHRGGRLLLDGLLLLVLLAPSFIVFRRSLSGDALIYLTFIRNFFTLPFSFQPGTVTFGATSPLHVLVHAPLALLLGAGFVPWSRVLNDLLIACGALALHRALRAGIPGLLAIAALLALDATLLKAAAEMFEAGVMFLVVSLLLCLIERGNTPAALAVAGLLPLVRPELLPAAVACGAVLLARAPRRRPATLAAAAGLVPLATYHLYMLAMTGRLVPTSVEARAITALESGRPWMETLRASLGAIGAADRLLYLLGGAGGVAALAAWWRLRRRRPGGAALSPASLPAEAALVLPTACLYLAVPPGAETPRYLLPLAPVLILWAARAALAAGERVAAAAPGLWRALRVRAAVAGGLAALAALAAIDARLGARAAVPRYDEDRLLLRDLAQSLGPRLMEGDRILIYEIQAQYVLPAFCLSADAIVGGQAIPALLGREPWEAFLRRERVRYVVTMESFNYRRIYSGTLLSRLYVHDRGARVGETMAEGGLRFRKVLENPALAVPGAVSLAAGDGLNGPDTIRVYGPADRLWAGHALLWGAVYDVAPAGADQPGG